MLTFPSFSLLTGVDVGLSLLTGVDVSLSLLTGVDVDLSLLTGVDVTTFDLHVVQCVKHALFMLFRYKINTE